MRRRASTQSSRARARELFEAFAVDESERVVTIPEALRLIEAKLVAAGFPPMSPFWMATFDEFYASGCRQLVLRVGRQGGKSSSLCRVAVAEALYGQHHIPPGGLGRVVVVSHKREEAADRLVTIRAILDVLGEPHKPIDGGIALTRRPIVFRVYTATIAGVSGPTSICVICDEVAKWKDADTGVNPAREVLASVRPTMITQKAAHIFLSSSPVGRLDAHAAAYDEGDTSLQRTERAATWEANPTVTEDETHALEPNEETWKREYAAIPMEGDVASLLSPALLDRATREGHGDLPCEPGVVYVAAQDPGFTRNAWTFVIAGKRWVEDKGPLNGPPVRRLKRSIVCVREWRGTAAAPLDPEWVLQQEAELCRTYGVKGIDSDQYERLWLQSIARRPEIGLLIRVDAIGSVDRLARAEQLVAMFSDDQIEIPPDRQLRADLLAVKQKLTANGFTLHLPETPDGRHTDYWPSASLALVNAALDPRKLAKPPHPHEGERFAEDHLRQVFEERADRNRQRDPLYPGAIQVDRVPNVHPSYGRRNTG